MSTALRITFRSAPDGRELPLVVSVLDAGLNTVHGPEAFLASERPVIEVAAGSYVVHVDAPSGQSLRQVLSVPEMEAAGYATIDISRLVPPTALGKAAFFHERDVRSDRRDLNDAQYAGLWARLWQQTAMGEWRETTFRPSLSSCDALGLRYEFQLSVGTYCVEVGGPGVPWRYVAVPASRDATVVLLPDGARLGELDVVASSGNDAAEAVLQVHDEGRRLSRCGGDGEGRGSSLSRARRASRSDRGVLPTTVSQP